MIAAFDIGNTNIDIAIFENDVENNSIIASFKMKIKKIVSRGWFFNLLSEELKAKNIEAKNIDTLVFSSVRPSIDIKIKQMWKKYFSNRIIEVKNDAKLGLINKYIDDVGPDRILGCVAAYNIYKENAIVVDLGTATTFNVVDKNSTFHGGIIVPGIYTSIQNLIKDTELLYPFTLKVSENVLANNTINALSNGLYYSNYFSIKGIIKKLAEELNFDNYITIGTGGNLGIFKDSGLFTYFDSHLVLKGLKFFYNNNLNYL